MGIVQPVMDVTSGQKHFLICDEDIESVKIQGVNYNFDNYTKHEGTEYDVINLFDDTDISSWSLDTNALKRFLVDQNSKPSKNKLNSINKWNGNSTWTSNFKFNTLRTKINYFNATENIDPMNDGLSCNGWSRIYANQKTIP